ncbi:unnamed protein product [Amaranthus hypochondriacus]
MYLFHTCFSIDSITTTKPLRDNDTIVSSQSTFKLGFFSPPNTTNRYLGIWYNKLPVLDVIWVANRMNPLKDSSGVVQISKDGNLQLINGLNKVLWSSNVTSLQGNNASMVARLLESGSLALLPASSSADNDAPLWQSFEHPTDRIMPSMTVSTKGSNDIKKLMIAWKSLSDPAYGRYSVGLDSYTLPEIIISDGDTPRWRSGPWNGNLFIGIPYNNTDNTNSGFNLQTDRQGVITVTYTYTDTTLLTNYELGDDGTFFRKLWVDDQQKWVSEWKVPQTECDLYGKCGAFGVCNPRNPVICECLKGFQPKNEEAWKKGNWSSGCVRSKPLQCGVRGGIPDKFYSLSNVKNPAKAHWSMGLDQDQCREQCTNNCSCIAYAFDSGAGCMSWSGDLVDTQTLSNGGVDLYLRLEHSELAESKKKVIVKAVTISLAGVIILLTIYCLLWRKAKERGKKLLKKKTLKDIFGGNISPDKLEELPLFDIKRLQIATNYFHESNQLGQGGFGLVYKGTLEDGQEIAVKRLSRASGQGTEEFVNEVNVISKLQHRNLVKLMGCCVEGEEKMLVYEYMPNKSLDAILFDEQKQENLSWENRFNIIDGICRGLLYLHRDSRLRIIHRDLKTSNILLDENLNPKISDFGMARIFVGNVDQADTRRVVGTYGYMPPEYAMEGKFSEKSDVFSFGVILLEIISGIKSNHFWHPDESLTLLGYAWKLWKEGNIDPLIDKMINKPRFKDQILTCVKVGLLCVQELAKDRPNIFAVIPMLTNHSENLPDPKKPAFLTRQEDYSEINSSLKSYEASSINDVSITIISSGR